ncbi:hypothetical protein [Thalassobaculum litoreum]|uniref:Uncharacterized protein n=1 Tax=Thalassobaculum litoreum DSM 18839 TaxID=1123362 RepID=A0A8G2BNQ0_9PROT|nr:hypothetical protein [Thalassobaculum litoreum]SDG61274.1 hypothetical protein SAMN05660686_05018 [Thalassobaculum litoreum DSM 18839]
MIAEKIESVLKSWHQTMRETGHFPFELFQHGLAELEDAARMARRLEAKPIPKRLRTIASTDPRDKVVDLAAMRRRSKRPGTGVRT